MKRVGVFVCWCGSNIAGTVDVVKVAEAAKDFPGVVHSVDYKYMCSEPGQEVIKNAIKEHRIERVVVASCSPRMHEPTFRKTIESAGLNQFTLEMANLREQCSWVHPNKEEGTKKAISLVKSSVYKVLRNFPIDKNYVSVTKKALVVGGGIAGIQAALDIADAGHKVVLVEKTPSIGGKMAQLDKTFPTLDCSACILTPKMVDAASHENIELITYAEVEEVNGYVGNFQVKIRKKAKSIDENECTGCGICQSKCPTKVSSEFETDLGERKAIYTPFPQAVPNIPVIDRDNCRYFLKGKCKVCQKLCPKNAVDFDQVDEIIEEDFGAIIMATGYDLFDYSVYGEYSPQDPDVITGLQFERLVNASGPTGGKIKRPSDGKEPKDVVFIKCVGSRDPHKGKPYCSKTCCMYTAKHATLMQEKYPDSQSYVFYMDVRTAGKGYEEFYKRTTSEYRANYIQGRVSKIYRRKDKLIVVGEDSLIGRKVQIDADMVVLATAMVPNASSSKTAQTFGFSYDEHGHFTEAHPKLRPVETNTAGIFLAGACQGPKDIPESVSQASAAAVKVCGLFSKDRMQTEPMVANVDESMCAGCFACIDICPYKAIEEGIIDEAGKGGKTREVSKVNETLCQGCGACTVACRSGALNLKGFTHDQILAEVDALCL